MYLQKTVLFIVLLLLYCVTVSGSCGASISQVERSFWGTGNDTYTVYDVTITNTDDSPILDIIIFTAQILNQFWNMESSLQGLSAPSYVTSAGGLAVGNSFDWGYIIIGSSPATFVIQDISCSTQPSSSIPTSSSAQSPTNAPATQPPATQPPATQAPATQAPATQPPATQAPATQAPATRAPATQAPATQPPATQAPATQAPATQAPTQPSGGGGGGAASAGGVIINTWVDQSVSLSYPAATPQTAQYWGSADPSGFCTGTPKMFQGKLCATSTRYWDGQTGACGCGTGDTNPDSFQWNKYTAAASPPIFGYIGWCGRGCGKCFNLTTTGYSPNGRGATAGQSIVVMATNLCPPQDPWCADGLTSFGYLGHFDLMDYNMAGIVSQLGWDNPEVTFEEVPCTGETPNAASSSDYAQCQCQ